MSRRIAIIVAHVTYNRLASDNGRVAESSQSDKTVIFLSGVHQKNLLDRANVKQAAIFLLYFFIIILFYVVTGSLHTNTGRTAVLFFSRVFVLRTVRCAGCWYRTTWYVRTTVSSSGAIPVLRSSCLLVVRCWRDEWVLFFLFDILRIFGTVPNHRCAPTLDRYGDGDRMTWVVMSFRCHPLFGMGSPLVQLQTKTDG